jgi:DNA-binding LacI/PurR family transcriptional regulator
MPPRPRLADVAARAGVSTASASLVLRGKSGPGAATREAVLDAARAIGYRPDAAASLLARRRTRLLGVTMDVSNPFHAELLEEIQAAADARGYDVVVSPLTRTRGERRAVESLLDFRCEGLLLLGPLMSEAELAELGERQAVVVVGRRLTLPGVDVVRAADDVGIGLAVEHLAGLGHRAITFLDGPRGAIATLRRQGYRASMRRLPGMAQPHILAGGDTEAAGADAARRLRDDPPTAVIAFNDRCALGLLDVLRRDGLDVPRDVSVVGYDDSPVARLATVDLTTVSQAPHAMAEAAVAAAVERLEGQRTDWADVVLAPHLVTRSTTGSPRAPRLE